MRPAACPPAHGNYERFETETDMHPPRALLVQEVDGIKDPLTRDRRKKSIVPRSSSAWMISSRNRCRRRCSGSLFTGSSRSVSSTSSHTVIFFSGLENSMAHTWSDTALDIVHEEGVLPFGDCTIPIDSYRLYSTVSLKGGGEDTIQNLRPCWYPAALKNGDSSYEVKSVYPGTSGLFVFHSREVIKISYSLIIGLCSAYTCPGPCRLLGDSLTG